MRNEKKVCVRRACVRTTKLNPFSTQLVRFQEPRNQKQNKNKSNSFRLLPYPARLISSCSVLPFIPTLCRFPSREKENDFISLRLVFVSLFCVPYLITPPQHLLHPPPPDECEIDMMMMILWCVKNGLGTFFGTRRKSNKRERGRKNEKKKKMRA